MKMEVWSIKQCPNVWELSENTKANETEIDKDISKDPPEKLPDVQSSNKAIK